MIIRRAASAAALAFAIVAAPSIAYTQPSAKIPRIGYLGPASPGEGASLLQSFRQGLRGLGYVEGQNILVDYRWTDGRPDRVSALAAELVQLKVDLIVTYHNQTVGALQKATRTIPIVVAGMSDPVGSGFVASLGRPGGNVTGFSSLAEDLNRKRMELLTEAVPKASRIAVLTLSSSPNHQRFWLEMQAAAGALKLTLQRQGVAGPDDIEPAFARLVQDRAQGLIVLPSAVTNDRRTQIVSLAVKHGLPGMYPDSQYVRAGGLMSYAADNSDLHRRAATYVDRLLKGAKPGDLPIQQPTKFELVINLQTATTLGLTIPPSILLRADQTIE
jgi:putative tryptophan/tyrosine transport system substrate-binding protein